MTRRYLGYAVVLLALTTTALAGCASGPVTGRVTTPGAPAGPLSMTWTSGMFGESGKMSAVMPDGERFAGTYQVVKPGMSRTMLEPTWTGEATAEAQGDIDDSFWGAAQDPAFVKRYENHAIATLRGSAAPPCCAGSSSMREAPAWAVAATASARPRRERRSPPSSDATL